MKQNDKQIPHDRAPRLSVCIVTQNCAHKLVHAIESVQSIADEIVVVEGSREGAQEVAASFEKARYFYHEWPDNYAVQKNYAMDQATGDWILILDSDEMIGANIREAIPKLIRSRRHDCYIFPTYWVLSQAPLSYVRSKELYPDYHQRLFRNLPRYRYDAKRKAHERFSEEVQGVGKKIKGSHIFHFDFVYNDRVAREKKVKKRSELLTPETDHISRTHYLFEDYPHKIKKCREKLW